MITMFSLALMELGSNMNLSVMELPNLQQQVVPSQ